MATKKRMGCGGCGCKSFSLFEKGETLVARCRKCKSESIVSIQSKLTIDWGKNATGRLTVFPSVNK